MQKYFIVPAIQHGRHANPPLLESLARPGWLGVEGASGPRANFSPYKQGLRVSPYLEMVAQGRNF